MMKRVLLGCLLALLLSPAGHAEEAALHAVPSAAANPAERAAGHNATVPAPQGNATLPVEQAATTGPQGDQSVHQLDSVEVEAEKVQSGSATIKGRELRSLPSHSGSITEALKGMSNVQFSNEETSGLTAGEIRPPRVSIAGAKPYENNFLIDGMSVTNTLNPGGLAANDSAAYNDMTVSGADQTIFYDSSLVESVTVHTSNVPAKYGSFVGGVVSAELVDPRKDKWHGTVSGKHTRSKWFELRGVDQSSETADNQPRFTINTMHASADGPVTDNAALLVSYSQKHSTIPLKINENDGSYKDKNQYRINENYFSKLTVTPDEDLKLSVDFTYAPYSEKRWRSAWPGSDWYIENEAYRFAAKAELATDLGDWTAKTAYSQNGWSRDSSNNYRSQSTGAGIPVADRVARGGVGDALTETRSIDAGLDFDLTEFETDFLLWRISTGLAVNNTTTDMWNQEAELSVYNLPANGRWIKTDTSYAEHSQSATLNTLGYYAQTEIQWDRFTLTPGFRVDYDDFSYNTDIAHRLKAELDTMGDGTVRLVAGYNRYYGSQLRAYAFDRYRPSLTRQERLNADMVTTTVTFTQGTDRSYQSAGIKTPYSDEITGGVLGTVLGLDYSVEVVQREHKDQIISKTRGNNLYELTNDGKSEYEGITVSLGRSFETEHLGSHTLKLGATQSKTKTFNGAYNSEIAVNTITNGFKYDYDKVYYNGEVINRADLPAEDYNAPLVLTLSWLGSFYEDRFRVNSVSRWKDSSSGLSTDSRRAAATPHGTTATNPATSSSQWVAPDGVNYYNAYKMGVISGGFVTDASFEFDALKEEQYTVTLLLDVLNVFSESTETSVTEGQVSRGRSVFAGIRCEF